MLASVENAEEIENSMGRKTAHLQDYENAPINKGITCCLTALSAWYLGKI